MLVLVILTLFPLLDLQIGLNKNIFITSDLIFLVHFSHISDVLVKFINMGSSKSYTKVDGESEDKPENIIWIEEVILNNLEDNPHSGSLSSVHSSSRISNSTQESATLKTEEDTSSTSSKTNQSPQTRTSELKIAITEIEFKDESYLGDDRLHCLSRIVCGKIKYYLTEDKNPAEEERFTHWLIKLPNLHDPQRQLSQLIDASKREIGFYTVILPNIKEWLSLHPPSQQIEFQVPTCFYGKFNRPVDDEPDFDIITHILDSESLLVLDDLRTCGYGKRHFGSGLLLSEAMAVVDEIVKVHVTTWAMQQIDKRKLNWSQLYDWQQLARLYSTLLDKSFPTIKQFLTSGTNHPNKSLILGKILKLKPQLYNKFLSLLKPPEDPLFPKTLIHMDLWTENVLFRMSFQDKEDDVPMEEAELDCCILDWQMVSYGSPTNDLALLLMLSLDPADRAKHSSLLLKYYYDSFRKTAKYFNFEAPFSLNMLADEFRRSCTLATLMAMASIDVVLLEDATQNRLLEALSDLIEEKLI